MNRLKQFLIPIQFQQLIHYLDSTKKLKELGYPKYIFLRELNRYNINQFLSL